MFINFNYYKLVITKHPGSFSNVFSRTMQPAMVCAHIYFPKIIYILY